MRSHEVDGKLRKILIKLFKRNKVTYNAVMDKIEEILSCEDIGHYKNLRNPLQGLKRVHISKSFVLTFKYIKSGDKVIFYKLDHHDRIYKS